LRSRAQQRNTPRGQRRRRRPVWRRYFLESTRSFMVVFSFDVLNHGFLRHSCWKFSRNKFRARVIRPSPYPLMVTSKTPSRGAPRTLQNVNGDLSFLGPRVLNTEDGDGRIVEHLSKDVRISVRSLDTNPSGRGDIFLSLAPAGTRTEQHPQSGRKSQSHVT